MRKTLDKIYEIFGLDGNQEVPYVFKGMSRFMMYEQVFNALEFKTGAEIGVWNGRNAKTIWKAMPDLMLYLVDPWIDYVGQRKKRGNDRLENGFRSTKKIAKGKAHKLLRMKSVEASLQVPDGSLDFVYIDGNHKYAYVMSDIILWLPKIKPGGIISGHDYSHRHKNHMEVKPAVLDYTRRHHISPWFLTDLKTEHAGRGGQASWFWVVS